MGQRRYEDLATNPEQIVALTSLTLEEIAELVGPFETAFQERMALWTLEGKRRHKRSYVTYVNSPLPTPEERLLFILSYLKENPTQTYHGYLYGMSQGKANQWIHTLFPVLQTALRLLGDAPARSFVEVQQRLERATEQSADTASSGATAPPLFATTAPSELSRAPSMRISRSSTIAARSASTQSKTSCS